MSTTMIVVLLLAGVGLLIALTGNRPRPAPVATGGVGAVGASAAGLIDIARSVTEMAGGFGSGGRGAGQGTGRTVGSSAPHDPFSSGDEDAYRMPDVVVGAGAAGAGSSSSRQG